MVLGKKTTMGDQYDKCELNRESSMIEASMAFGSQQGEEEEYDNRVIDSFECIDAFITD